jgi:hypothetical protein
MGREIERLQIVDDSASQKGTRKTDSPKSPLDRLSPEKRHLIFSQKVDGRISQKSLLGDNSQKQRYMNPQNKLTEKQPKNDDIADEALIQAHVEHVSQDKTGRREGFASTLDSAEIPPKRESSRSYGETVKLLSEKSLTQFAKETVGWAWQTLSEKSLTQLAKETVTWTWQNGVKALSAKKFMHYLAMYLAVSSLRPANAIKIYGKNGCSIDSHLIIYEYPPDYDNAGRIVKEQFEQTFPKLVERYAKDPCDKKYEKMQVFFDPSFDPAGYIPQTEPTYVFLRPIESEYTDRNRTLRSAVIHAFSHVPLDIVALSHGNDGFSVVYDKYKFLIDKFITHLTGDTLLAYRWVANAVADYNVYIYGTKQDTEHWPLPPNLESYDDYTTIYPPAASGFVFWLDRKFPGFVDEIIRIAQERYISFEDIEKCAGGQSLRKLWREYKKDIDFATKMPQFIEEQRQKYLGSDQEKIVSSHHFGERKTDPLAGFGTEVYSPSDNQHSQATAPQSIEKIPPTSSRLDSRFAKFGKIIGPTILLLVFFHWVMLQARQGNDAWDQLIEGQRERRDWR